MHQLSVWEKESFFSPRDVIIIGSGFVGLWSAYYLKKTQPKLKITVVDRGIIPTGASTRNAGFACFGSVTELMADKIKMGESGMLDLVELRCKGLRKIRKTFRDREIEYEGLGGYELITDNQPLQLNELRSNLDWLNRKLGKIVKKNKAFYLDDAKIKSLGFAGVRHLIENRLEGQLHSGKLCECLLKLVQSMGVLVLNNLEILGYEKIRDRIDINTNLGITLSASQILICTNAFAKQLLPQLDVEPARGQVLVTSPIPNLRLQGTFHFDEGFYYFRNLGKRVLLGGARNIAFEQEHSAEMHTTELIQSALEKFLQTIVMPGESFTIEHRWSGIMGIGAEKWPIVKKLDGQIFCAVRMSGMGVALAPEIGKKVAEMMVG